MVDPRHDRICAAPEGIYLKAALPSIVFNRTHGLFDPLGLVSGSKEYSRTQQIMPIGKDIRPNAHLFANGAFDWKPTAVNFGLQVFNDDPAQCTHRWFSDSYWGVHRLHSPGNEHLQIVSGKPCGRAPRNRDI